MITIPIVKSELKTQTPAEIDTQLAEIYGRLYTARAKARNLADIIARDAKRRAAGSRYFMDSTDLARTEAHLAEATLAANLIEAETIPFQVEYHRRGGWTRAYLVQNNGGHVHNSMHCATCFPTTQFGWLTQVSDHTEAEIVELAGEGACSVCYPTAPRIGRNRLELPATIAGREERAAAKAERDAKRAAKAIGPIVLTPEVYGHNETIRTISTAWSTLVDIVANNRAYGYSDKPAAREILADALAARLEVSREEIDRQLEVKVIARIKREAR